MCSPPLVPRSQTLFGNAVRETPFRAALDSVGNRRETEFREVGSQTEFGNQKNQKRREAELRSPVFPNSAWEREEGDVQWLSMLKN